MNKKDIANQIQNALANNKKKPGSGPVTQAQLADLIGVRQPSISKFLSGSRYSISEDKVQKICMELGIKTEAPTQLNIPETLVSAISNVASNSSNPKKAMDALTKIISNIGEI